jgi:hypothetical protein
VAELLRSHGGTLELVDARQFMPLFKARPGLQTWYVLDDHFVVKNEIQARKAAKQQQYDERKRERDLANAVAAETVDTDATTAAENTVADNTAVEVEAEAAKDYSHVTDAGLRACLEMGFLHFNDVQEVPDRLRAKFRQSLFPPSDEERAWMHLERCLRCVPQDEDTGGFFVATFRKVSKEVSSAVSAVPVATASTEEVVSAEELAAAEQAATAVDDNEAAVVCCENDNEDEGAVQKSTSNNHNNKGSARGLVEFFPWEIEAFQKLQSFYQFDEKLTVDNFFIREDVVTRVKQPAASTGAKSVYYLPRAVRAILEGDQSKQLKVVTAGIKVFEKKVQGNGEPDYRLLQEGVPFLLPHIRARRVQVSVQDFSNLLGGGLVSYSTLSPQTIAQLCTLAQGVVICTYTYSPADYLPATEVAGADGAAEKEGEEEKEVSLGEQGPREGRFEFHTVVWKGTSRTVNVMCGRVEIDTMKHQLAVLGVLRAKVMVKRETAAAADDDDEKMKVKEVSGNEQQEESAMDEDVAAV